MKQIKIYVRNESEIAYDKLKAFDINLQSFIRKAIIKKVVSRNKQRKKK